MPPYGASLGYFAAKSVDPGHPPAHLVDLLYADVYILALGIQLAGPDLTPATFERGLASYARRERRVRAVGVQRERRGVWSPNTSSASSGGTRTPPRLSTGKKGTWVVGVDVLPRPADVPSRAAAGVPERAPVTLPRGRVDRRLGLTVAVAVLVLVLTPLVPHRCRSAPSCTGSSTAASTACSRWGSC